jgi:ribosomal-protein-alanine N-acetyltransferase
MTILEVRAGVRLRPWVAGDAAALRRHADNPNVARYLLPRFPTPYTDDDVREWLEGGGLRPENWAIEVDGEACGGLGIHPDEDERGAEIGYWLGEAYWGRGIVTDAVRAAVAHAFGILGIERLYARVYEGNGASMRVLEHNGFVAGEWRATVDRTGASRRTREYLLERPH